MGYCHHTIERRNKELKRRSDARSAGAGGIVPTAAAVGRLRGALLSAPHDEWQAGRRYFSVESLAKLMAPLPELAPPLLAAS